MKTLHLNIAIAALYLGLGPSVCFATKKFFGSDGVLHETADLPDGPFADAIGVNAPNDNPFVSATNPTGADPELLSVDAAALPNLVPTQGATPPTRFPEPLPGTGEGAGVGQPSGATLRDAWNNNPQKDAGTVETIQSGDVGSALTRQDAKAAEVTNTRLANDGGDQSFEDLQASWANKDAVRAYIVDNGGDEPHAAATRAELEESAREVYDRKQLA